MSSSFYSSKIIFILLFTMFLISSVGGLKCYCNVLSSSCPNSTCVTDGFCFASKIDDINGPVYTYQCWNQDTIFPPGGRPIWCREAESPDTVMCCTTDFCNHSFFTKGMPLAKLGSSTWEAFL